MSSFKYFNQRYLQKPSNCINDVINELSCFLDWNPDNFVVKDLEAVHALSFFTNLNELMEHCDSIADTWVVFQVIEIAVQNRSTRQMLINDVRIITGATYFALRVTKSMDEDKQIRIWKFIENITRDIVVEFEEPYLTAMIEYLAASITNVKPTNKSLYASILTNLCFNNEIAINSLTRFVKSTTLLKSIHEIRVLWCKMAVATARFGCSYVGELETNLKSIFESDYFSGLVNTKDTRLLRHILELLEVGLRKDEHLQNIMEKFDFKKPIEEVLSSFEKKMDVEVENGNEEKDDSEHITLFLGIVNAILSVPNVFIQSSMQGLFTLAIDNIGTDNISPTALKTVRLVIARHSSDIDSNNLVDLLRKLIDHLQRCHQNSLVQSEMYLLFTAMLTNYDNIVTQVPQEVLNKCVDTTDWSFVLTKDNLAMQLHRLEWYMTYISRYEELQPKLSAMMQNKEVHRILSSGLHNSNQELCYLTMMLIRSKYFPVQSVSKLLSNQVSRTVTPTPGPSLNGCHSKPISQATATISVPPSLTKRFEVVVERILSNPIENIEMNQLRDILEFQSITASKMEDSLHSIIKMSSDTLATQKKENGGLKAIIQFQGDTITDLKLKEESLNASIDMLKTSYQTQKSKYDTLDRELTTLKKSFADMTQKNDELGTAIKRYKKRLTEYENKVEAIKKENNQLKMDHAIELNQKTDEILKYQQDLKKSQGIINLATTRLDEKERQLEKSLDEIKKYKTQIETITSVLQNRS